VWRFLVGGLSPLIMKRGETMQYASLRKRALAKLVDEVVLAILVAVLVKLTALFWHDVAAAWAELMVIGCIVFCCSIWLYRAVLESSSQRATFGKQALGLTVTDLDGNQLTFGAASTRHFGKIISGFCFIGYIFAAFMPKRQGLQDMMAGALVLERR
jgi:uncharacterized RDD family membrane protein YckC